MKESEILLLSAAADMKDQAAKMREQLRQRQAVDFLATEGVSRPPEKRERKTER